MSVKLMSLVFEAKMEPTRKLIMLALADHANDEGRHVYPSNDRLARRTGLKVRTIQRERKRLLDDGLLTPVRLGGGKLTNEYNIDVRKLQELALVPHDSESPPPRSRVTPPMTQSHPPHDSESPDPLINHHIEPKPNGTKPDFVDLLLSQESSPEVKSRRAMRARFQKALGKTPNWDSSVKHSNWFGLETFLLEEDKAGRTIETWAQWWLSDEFRAQNGVAYLTAEKIRENWMLAFANAVPNAQAKANRPAFKNQPNRPLPTGV